MQKCHERLAELWMIAKKRELTDEEQKEFQNCMEANAELAYRLAHLKNLSLLASITHDIEWQHEICADIDELERI